jgi:hypothetical protein
MAVTHLEESVIEEDVGGLELLGGVYHHQNLEDGRRDGGVGRGVAISVEKGDSLIIEVGTTPQLSRTPPPPSSWSWS